MKPEEAARENIDGMLAAAEWEVQDYADLSLGASRGIAIREFPLKTGTADYLLFVDRKAVGVIEAKPEGTTLSGVAEQSDKYTLGLPDHVPCVRKPLPFAYESTGQETFFRDQRDPFPRSRRLSSFHQPQTLSEWLLESDTLRSRLRELPPLITTGLRVCQTEAIGNLEESFGDARPRALIQMAPGSGKTFTAVSFAYRLIKFANARRILFLVDRNTLGKQTRNEFQQYVTPDDGRKFTELYNIQRLTANAIDPVSRVCITTIQRLYSMLLGQPEYAEEDEEPSAFELPLVPQRPKEVDYNPAIPIETFDFIITDECHRSIYNLWRQVLEYFDAFIIGLTATPSKQTLGFFDQNLVMEYSHERAIADRVNVGYDVYSIKTEITEKGGKVDKGFYVDKRDKLTRRVHCEQLDEELEYTAAELDRSVVAKDQIRTVIKTFKDALFTEIFPGRTEVPKTLVFAKDDSHAEDIVHIVREEFGKGNDFCKKITYRTREKPEDLIASFRNSYNPRIAVTVDMISTGTDIRPLECLLFMRDVRSGGYFEQMKGRGCRVISSTDLQSVTPDTDHKTHYVIVDAVGVCETDKTDTRPLERKRNVSFDKLVQFVAVGQRDEDTLSSLFSRLSRLECKLDEKDLREIKQASGGIPLEEILSRLQKAIDPGRQEENAKEVFGTDSPTEEQIRQSAEDLADEACVPFDNPKFREVIIDIHRRNEQVIDNVSKDSVTFSGFDAQAKEKAQSIVQTFRKFIEDNKDELTALQILYSRPYSQRHLTFEVIKQLSDAIERPPYRLSREVLWQAYEQLEKSKVRGAGPKKLLTDIISLVRFAVGKSNVLEPFSETVERRFGNWLEEQAAAGRRFTPEQMAWLKLIKGHVATSVAIDKDAFELTPFSQMGGLVKVYQLFGPDFDGLMQELNERLAA